VVSAKEWQEKMTAFFSSKGEGRTGTHHCRRGNAMENLIHPRSDERDSRIVSPSGALPVAVVARDEWQRCRLRQILERSSDVGCAGCFASATEAFVGVPRSGAAAAVLDIDLPEICDIECARRLKRESPAITIVVLSRRADRDTAGRARDAGIDAFLVKPFLPQQLVAALHFSQRPAAPSTPAAPRRSEILPLTGRQREILALLADGLLYKEIAARLAISFSAVHKHVSHLYSKLHATNRTEALNRWQDLRRSKRPGQAPRQRG
jgi:DNA-binding NarL/FixJ family response regulator